MLKACFDCLAGDQQRREGDTYGVHLNGGTHTQGPPWQSFNNSSMFPLPTLRAGNQIIVKGQMTSDKRLNIEIATSYSAVCQINLANRKDENDEDFLNISSHGNAAHESLATEFFNSSSTEYLFRFEVEDAGSIMAIFAGLEEGEADQFVCKVAIDAYNLKTMSVNGEVEKLIFIFK